ADFAGRGAQEAGKGPKANPLRMRVVIAGLGVQGKKRLAIAGSDAVATVDPVASDARYKRIEDVPIDTFDSALVCTPDSVKVPILTYLLGHGKHVLVEKPLIAD